MEAVADAVTFGLGIALVLTAAIFGLVAVAIWASGGKFWGILREVEEDKVGKKHDRPSLARLQAFIWTVVILLFFIWIYAIRLRSGVAGPPSEIPGGILALMGITAGATVASLGIPRVVPGGAKLRKGGVPGNVECWRWLAMFYENDKPSLARIQSFAWTVVAVLIYVWVVYLTVTDPAKLAAVELLALPNVDPSLAILTGFSQAAYVGAKARLAP